MLWPTVCQCHYSFTVSAKQSHHIHHAMTNSEWVTLPSDFLVISSHLITNRMWVTLAFYLPCRSLIAPHPSHNNQQYVSNIALLFVRQCVITSCPMTYSMWVTLPFFCQAISSCPIVCEWLTAPFTAMNSHHVDLVTNSKWVTLHIFWSLISYHGQQRVSNTALSAIQSHQSPNPSTASEWHCPYFTSSLTTSHSMANRM